MEDWEKALRERIQELSRKIDDLVALRDAYVMSSKKYQAPVQESDDKAGY